MKNVCFAGLFVLLMTGCAPFLNQPFTSKDARLGTETPVIKQFQELPAPKEKIVASVYKFRDQTGQYKPSETGANWSTAVTQGATSILLRALEESEWFVPLERENLGNLMNERKIIRSSRAQYLDGSEPQQSLLPPLLFAGIILEGGIISYDANVITGGAGLRYFGAGASGQYREDRVTVYLRAISTSNGRILKTVYTTKTILSQMVDVGLFKYVKFKRLLETEAGFTYNEPTEIAVKDAIEKAVYSLIVEGIMEGLWQAELEDPLKSEAVQEYISEKEINKDTDILNRYQTPRRGRIGLGAYASTLIYNGDYSSPAPRPGLLLQAAYNRNNWEYGFKLGVGELATQRVYQTTLFLADFNSAYKLYPLDRYTPYISASIGTIASSQQRELNDFRTNIYGKAAIGIGFEYLLTDQLGLNFLGNYHYLFTDMLDNRIRGRYNDAFWEASVGIKLYFGK